MRSMIAKPSCGWSACGMAISIRRFPWRRFRRSTVYHRAAARSGGDASFAGRSGALGGIPGAGGGQSFFISCAAETSDPTARLHARMMFYNGEDSATGSAAGCARPGWSRMALPVQTNEC